MHLFHANIPVMILAAGRGERMRPLTDELPKPLLTIHGKSLLEYHLQGLSNHGFQRVVINHAWLGHLIESAFKDGEKFQLNISYSPEEIALETAGGIAKALPLLNPEDYFLVVNGDVFAPDFPFHRVIDLVEQFRADIDQDAPALMAYLFLAQNPSHHPKGDFYLNPPYIFSDDQLENNALSQRKYTFSGIGIYHKDLFQSIEPGTVAPLAPLLKKAMGAMIVEGELLKTPWHDVGTPQRLLELNQRS